MAKSEMVVQSKLIQLETTIQNGLRSQVRGVFWPSPEDGE